MNVFVGGTVANFDWHVFIFLYLYLFDVILVFVNMVFFTLLTLEIIEENGGKKEKRQKKEVKNQSQNEKTNSATHIQNIQSGSRFGSHGVEVYIQPIVMKRY